MHACIRILAVWKILVKQICLLYGNVHYGVSLHTNIWERVCDYTFIFYILLKKYRWNIFGKELKINFPQYTFFHCFTIVEFQIKSCINNNFIHVSFIKIVFYRRIENILLFLHVTCNLDICLKVSFPEFWHLTFTWKLNACKITLPKTLLT